MGAKKQRGRPRQDPEVRRRQILDAAVSLFSEKSYGTADLQVIAERAGIAKGTVYLYFKSKRQLFLAAVDHAVERLAGSIEREVTAASGPLEKVKAVFRAHLQFFDEDPALAEMVAREGGEFVSRAQQTYFRVFSENASRLEAILHEGIADGIFRASDPRQTTEILANLLYGSIYTHVIGRAKAPAASSIDAITDFLLYGIVAKQRGTKA